MNKAGFWTIEKALSRAEKYKTRKEMSKQDGGAYSFLRDKGLLGLLDPIIPSTKKNWSIETILITARLYEKREDFLKLNPSAYRGLVKRKALSRLDEVFPPLKSKPWNYWTLDLILNIAQKYPTKKEFKRNNRCAYEALKNKKQTALLNKIFPDEIHKGYWMEKENVIKEARKYKTRTDFQKECSSAYSSAIKMGWLDEACSEMISDRKPYGYWQKKENVIAEIKKYKTLNDFSKNAVGAYATVLKNRWHDLLLPLKRSGDHYHKCVYRIISEINNKVYIGITGNFEKRMCQHKSKNTKHLTTKPFVYYSDTKYEKITEYLNSKEACRLEDRYIKLYKKIGFDVLNIKKAGGLGCKTQSPTKDLKRVREEAAKYNSFMDYKTQKPINAKWLLTKDRPFLQKLFPDEVRQPKTIRKQNYWSEGVILVQSLICEKYSDIVKNKNLYSAVNKFKMQSRLRKLIPCDTNPPNFWNKQRVLECAAKCKTMSEFNCTYPSARVKAQRSKWLKEISEIYKPEREKS